MKNVVISVCFLAFTFLSASSAFSQEESEHLLEGGTRFSGFGGPLVEFSSVNGDFAISTGGGGGALINNRFFIGGYGMGLINTVNSTFDDDIRIETDFGHGGLWLGGIIRPAKAIHFGVSTKLGWGEIDFRESAIRSQLASFGRDDVFVVTPQLEVEANVTRWFKINAGIGYRKTFGVDNPTYQSTDFDSGVATLSFLFGWF